MLRKGEGFLAVAISNDSTISLEHMPAFLTRRLNFAALNFPRKLHTVSQIKFQDSFLGFPHGTCRKNLTRYFTLWPRLNHPLSRTLRLSRFRTVVMSFGATRGFRGFTFSRHPCSITLKSGCLSITVKPS